jgi:hypothetical protein
MRMRRAVAIAVAVAAAATGLAGAASASSQSPPGFLHPPPQLRLLDRGCNAAVPHIENMLNRAWATQILTVQTQVRVLRPGKLTGDIAFNPSGSTITVAADASAARTVAFACGYGVGGNQTGSSSAGLGEGQAIPKKHVVALVRETFTKPGRYTLTFTLNRQGQRILARLGAAERAYRKHNPHGKQPPTITWGIGLHYQPNG